MSVQKISTAGLVLGALTLGLVPLMNGAALAQSTQIGVAAAIIPSATGTPAGLQTRTLSVGVNVFSNEAVVTGPKGQAQMLFLDESALTIGPNSNVTLDEFVYDPGAKTGKIALTAVKGVFRLVGGKISKRTPVRLKTPTAVIGIRGGIVMVDAAANGATRTTFLFGREATVESGGVTQTITRPGYFVETVSGQPPSAPAPASVEVLSASLSALEEGGRSDDEADTGDADVPSDADVAASGVDDGGSSEVPADVAPVETTTDTGGDVAVDTTEIEESSDKTGASQDTASTSVTSKLTISETFKGRLKHATTPTNGTDDSSSSLNVTFSDGSITEGILTATMTGGSLSINAQKGSFTATSTSQPFGSSVLTGNGFITSDLAFGFYELTDSGDNHKVFGFGGDPVTGVPTSGTTFYSLQDDFVMGSSIPFMRLSDIGSLTPPESEGTVDTAIMWDTTGSSTAVRAFGHRTIAISGQGSSQVSAMSVAVGEVLLDSNSLPFIDGAVTATSRLTTTGTIIVVEGEISSSDDAAGNDFFGGGTSPNYFVLEGNEVNTSDVITVNGIQSEVSGTTATIQPNAVALVGSDTVGTRTSRTMNGYAGGLLQATSSSGTLTSSTLFQNENSDPGDIIVKTSATTNKIQADINVKDGFGSNFTFFRNQFGDHDTAFGDGTTTHGDSIFLDDTTFGAIDSETDESTISNGTVSSDGTNLAMVTVRTTGEFDSSFVPSGVTICACEFASWGFWSAEISMSDSTHQTAHLATWVAGEIPTFTEISAITGSATYGGHAIANVLSGSDAYLAVGGWSYTVNFDSPTSSSGTLSDFDSGTYTIGSATLSSGTNSLNTISGSLTGSAGTGTGRSGSFLGSFMKTSSDNAAGMGGHFSVSGTDYKASGTFVGKK
jgi:hypothetical protein